MIERLKTAALVVLLLFSVQLSGATPDPQRSPYAPLGSTVQAAVPNFTGTADHQVFAAAGSGVRNYVTSIYIGNGAGAEGTVTVKDGSTTLHQFRVFGDSGDSYTFIHPLRGSTNTAINVATDNGSQSLFVSAIGFTSAE